MNGKAKTILLVVLLIVVGAVGFYKVEKSHEAKQKQIAIQEQKAQEAKQAQADKIAAEKAAYEAQQQQNQGSNQVVGATTYPDGELINIANENYAQFMHNNNTYNFESVQSKETNGDVLTATFSATCNGQPQTITMNFKQVNNVVTIVPNNA